MIRRVAVIGFDHMHAGDQIALAQTLPTVDLVGVWDTDQERLDSVGEDLRIDRSRRFTDLEQLVAETAPEIAVVCTETADHRLFTEFFCSRGIHVLLEKPFAASGSDAYAMRDAAERGSVLLGVNWPLEWYPVHRTTHRLIAEGSIGKVREVHYYDGNRGPLFHSHGKRELDPGEAADIKANTWWYQASAGGGSLRDYLGYGATLATWFRDGEAPIEVTARTHIAIGDEVDEQSVVIAAYSGGLSTFQTRWGTFTDPWIHQPSPRCGFVVVGEHGTIASFDYADHVQLQDHDYPEGTQVPVDDLADHEASGLAAFVHALNTGQSLFGPLSGAVSLAGQYIIDAAAESARTHATVRVAVVV